MIDLDALDKDLFPQVDDGEDLNYELPNIYYKNGDAFLRVDFAYGPSTLNTSPMNGYKFNE